MRHIGVTLAVLVSLAAVVGLLVYVRSLPADPAPVIEQNAAQDVVETIHGMRVGDPVTVGNVDSEDPEQTICMIREMSDIEAVRTMVKNQDHEGMRQFMGRRRASLIRNRTPARLLEFSENYCRVRIVQGENRGREGWIDADFLLKEGPTPPGR